MVDIVIRDADGVPEDAHLSLKVGDMRRQMPYKPGANFRFQALPSSFVVDIFQKVGSANIVVEDIPSSDGNAKGAGAGDRAAFREGDVDVLLSTGSKLKMSLGIFAAGNPRQNSGVASEGGDMHHVTSGPGNPLLQQEAAVKAKNYLEGHAVQKTLQMMVQRLLEAQPEDPTKFMVNFLQEAGCLRPAAVKEAPPAPGSQPVAASAEPRVAAGSPVGESSPAPEAAIFADEADGGGVDAEDGEESDGELPEGPGLGQDWPPGFPVDDCPDSLPDLSAHHNLCAEILRADTSVYSALRSLRTPLGVSLAVCIKTGVDNPGHAFISSLGLVAGDEHCYDTFRQLFDRAISSKRAGVDLSVVQHVSDLDMRKLGAALIDPIGKCVKSVSAKVVRNFAGLRFAPACSRSERRESEWLVVSGLMALGVSSGIRGEYEPMRHSVSYAPRPGGMSKERQAELRRMDWLIEEPDSQVVLASGFGRHWPDARGVFVSDDGVLRARVNEEDHICIEVRREGDALQAACGDLFAAVRTLESEASRRGRGFAYSPRLGYLTSSPSNVGTGLVLSVTMSIPKLAERFEKLQPLLEILGVQARTSRVFGNRAQSITNRTVYDIMSLDSGVGSEVEQVNKLLQACRVLAAIENREAGQP